MNQQQIIEQYGKYDLLRKIGQGGMAEVYLANLRGAPPNTPQIVIKRLHRELESDPETVDLFLTEADVTLLLSHPNIISVYESGEIDGRYYMAMEYLQGTDLDRLMQVARKLNQHIPLELAIFIIKEVLQGIAYIQTARSPSGKPLGIVHRDITPSNVWISGNGHIKLGDFGVAKLVGVESWTMAGSIKGKLGYFAPEQMAGEPISQSIDLYAGAIILYELCTGKNCFDGNTELDIMLKIRDAKFIKPRKYRKEIPRGLQSVIMKALHKKQRKRYQDANELIDALDEVMRKYYKDVTVGQQDLCNYMHQLRNQSTK